MTLSDMLPRNVRGEICANTTLTSDGQNYIN